MAVVTVIVSARSTPLCAWADARRAAVEPCPVCVVDVPICPECCPTCVDVYVQFPELYPSEMCLSIPSNPTLESPAAFSASSPRLPYTERNSGGRRSACFAPCPNVSKSNASVSSKIFKTRKFISHALPSSLSQPSMSTNITLSLTNDNR